MLYKDFFYLKKKKGKLKHGVRGRNLGNKTPKKTRDYHKIHENDFFRVKGLGYVGTRDMKFLG